MAIKKTPIRGEEVPQRGQDWGAPRKNTGRTSGQERPEGTSAKDD